jgi:ATPase subunit of ABC transporter with duplicated ATPase domains
VGDLEHPLAKQFPLMPENELEELAEDVRENDLHEKIVIYAGKILDGRNRYLACKLNGRQFTGAEFCDYDELYSGDPELYVISRNIKRRQLTSGQRAAWGHEYDERMEKAKRGRPVARESAPRAEENSPSIDGELLYTRERKAEAAAVTGSSVESIERFAHLKKVAPEKAEEVKAGTKTLNAAIQEAAEKTGKRPPRKPKVVKELKDGLTLRQIFDMMLERGDKTLEVRVIGQGGATFTTDADIKPKTEVLAPSRDEFMAYAAQKRIDLTCAADQFEIWEAAGWVDGNQTPIVNWKSKLLHFARGFFGQFQKLERKKTSTPARAAREQHNQNKGGGRSCGG